MPKLPINNEQLAIVCSPPPLVISTKAAMLPRGEISFPANVRVTGTEHLLLHAQVFRNPGSNY